MDDWHFSRDGRAIGPVGFEALIAEVIAGRLKPDDLVWTPSFTAWQAARTIPALFPDGVTPPARREAELAAAREDRFGPRQFEPSVDRFDDLPSRRSGGGIIGRHWRGELPLWQSFWLICVLFKVVFVITALAVDPWLQSLIISDPLVGLLSSLGLLIVVPIMLSVWQWTGVWRSARRHEALLGRSSIWAALVKLSVIIGVLTTITGLANAARQWDTAPAQRQAAPRTPPVAVELRGTTLVLRGNLGPGSADLVARTIRDRPVTTFELDSGGGLIAEGRAIARLAADRRARTVVPQVCHSSCTLILLAGSYRSMAMTAQIGFHRPSSSDPRVSIEGAVREMSAAYRELGMPDSFTDRVMATPNDTLLTPSPRELIALGIVHEISVDGTSLATALRTSAHFAAMERFDRPQFDAFVESAISPLRAGASMEEAMAAGVSQVERVLTRYVSRAPDGLVNELIALELARAEWLLERAPAGCSSASANVDALQANRAIVEAAPDFLPRTQAVYARIIESAMRAPRPSPTVDEARAAFERYERLLRRASQRIGGARPARSAASDLQNECRETIAQLRALRDMPEAERALVFRFLSSPEVTDLQLSQPAQ